MAEKNYNFLIDYIKYNITEIEKSNIIDKKLVLASLNKYLDVDLNNKSEMDIVISKLFKIHQTVFPQHFYVDFDRYTNLDGEIR